MTSLRLTYAVLKENTNYSIKSEVNDKVAADTVDVIVLCVYPTLYRATFKNENYIYGV